MKNIYLISGKARNGKDTLADFCIEGLETKGQEACKIALASSLKSVARKTGWNGEKDAWGRSYLQGLGDFIKKGLGNDCFAKALVEAVKEETCENIFICDVRFKEELTYLDEAFNEAGYNVKKIRVYRPEFISELTNEAQAHRSECDLDDYDGFDMYIENRGIESYKESALSII